MTNAALSNVTKTVVPCDGHRNLPLMFGKNADIEGVVVLGDGVQSHFQVKPYLLGYVGLN